MILFSGSCWFSMSDEDWEDLDRQVFGLVRLTLTMNIALSVANQTVTVCLKKALLDISYI